MAWQHEAGTAEAAPGGYPCTSARAAPAYNRSRSNSCGGCRAAGARPTSAYLWPPGMRACADIHLQRPRTCMRQGAGPAPARRGGRLSPRPRRLQLLRRCPPAAARAPAAAGASNGLVVTGSSPERPRPMPAPRPPRRGRAAHLRIGDAGRRAHLHHRQALECQERAHVARAARRARVPAARRAAAGLLRRGPGRRRFGGGRRRRSRRHPRA